MTRDIDEILRDIAYFQPADDNWRKLDDLMAELWETQQPERGMDVMLGVLERFPEEDGAGVLWSVVHGLETLPGYEDKLIESVQRRPSHLGLVMISRILNTGVFVIENKSITAILEKVLQHKKATPVLLEEAEKIRKRVTNHL